MIDWFLTKPVTNPDLTAILENEIRASGKTRIRVDFLESYRPMNYEPTGKSRAVLEKKAKNHYEIRLYYSTHLVPKACVIRSVCHEMGHIYHGDADKHYRTYKVEKLLPGPLQWMVSVIGTFVPCLFDSDWYTAKKEKRAWKYAHQRMKAYGIPEKNKALQ